MACPYFVSKEVKDTYNAKPSQCCGTCQRYIGEHCTEEAKLLGKENEK